MSLNVYTISRDIVQLRDSSYCLEFGKQTFTRQACSFIYSAPRTIGLGMSSGAARVGGILSPIILLLKDYVPSLPSILFGSSAVLAGLLALLLPETRGRKLPQTLEEGEEMGK